MRKLASVCIVDTVTHVENSDFLDVVTLKGKAWRCLIERDTVALGEYVVFFEIDSALPVDDPRYEFLRSRCYKRFVIEGQTVKECFRIRTQKLRGVVSQGLVLKATEFPELLDQLADGNDVTEVLRVEHFDELREKWSPKVIPGDHEGMFPHWLEKSDEERIQNMSDLFSNDYYRKMEFEITEKYDGCSATYFYVPSLRNEGQRAFGVCSRNFELKESTDNVYWEIARRYKIESLLENISNETGKFYAIQGEIVGPGINRNRDKYVDYDFYVYRVFDILKHRVLPPSECRSIVKTLGLNHVKVIAESKPFGDFPSLNEMLEFVEGKTEHGNEREGMVFKEVNGLVHFKCISNKYLLAEKD